MSALDVSDGKPRRKRRRWLNPFGRGQSPGGRMFRALFLLVVLLLLASPVICWYEYQNAFPAYFDPVPAPAKSGKAVDRPPRGVVFTDTLIVMGKGMLNSWLPNDVIYPTIFLDNPQNFQLGQLEGMRYSTRVLRDKLSRQRTTDKIDPFANRAFTDFSKQSAFLDIPLGGEQIHRRRKGFGKVPPRP